MKHKKINQIMLSLIKSFVLIIPPIKLYQLVKFLPLAFLVLNLSCVVNAPREIKIAAIIPLTGVAADIGIWAQKGIDLAIAELNNPERKLKIEVIYEDSKLDPREGITAFKKVVDLNKVIAVITSGSGVVLSIAPEAQRLHIIQLNYSAVNPQIKLVGDYTFSLVNDSNLETEEMAEFIIDSLGIMEIAILYANTSYGVGTKDVMVHNFVARGGKIIGIETYDENDVNMKPALTKLKAIKPRAIYLPGTIKDAATILKQSREIGFKTQWLSYNAIEGPALIEVAGKAADGLIYTSSNLYDLPYKDEREANFYQKYKRKYFTEPTIYSATAYDAVMLIAAGVATTEGSSEAVKEFLHKTVNYAGASGTISFDSTGSVKKPIFFKIIKNGNFSVYTKSLLNQ